LASFFIVQTSFQSFDFTVAGGVAQPYKSLIFGMMIVVALTQSVLRFCADVPCEAQH
jgi:hypothetical protein